MKRSAKHIGTKLAERGQRKSLLPSTCASEPATISLNGGDGRDDLTGLDGQDRFLFNTTPNAASNLERMTDFNVAEDTIQLDTRETRACL